jgi:hypothetical protein
MDEEIKEKSVKIGCFKKDIEVGFWTEEYNMFGKAQINSYKRSMYIGGVCHTLTAQSNTKEVTFVIDGV